MVALRLNDFEIAGVWFAGSVDVEVDYYMGSNNSDDCSTADVIDVDLSDLDAEIDDKLVDVEKYKDDVIQYISHVKYDDLMEVCGEYYVR